MGIISDIIDLVKGAKSGLDELTPKNFVFKTTRNSISRKSSNSILQFPVICSSALSPDELMMVSKALEREYAQFVRIAASLDDVIDADTPAAKAEKLRSLHQNIGYQGQPAFGRSNGRFFMSESDNMSYTALCEAFEKKNIELLKVVNEDLNPVILNDLTVKNNRNYYNFKEDNFDKMSKEELEDEITRMRAKQLSAQITRDKERENRELQKYEREMDRYSRDEQREEREIEKNNRELDKYNREKEKGELERERTFAQRISSGSSFQNQLLPTDIKKANELIPTMMDLKFLYKTKMGQMVDTSIIVGVKTVNHLVTSDEMMFNIASAVKEKRHFFKFLQWTTGEIEMVKDWILAKDKIKDEVRRQREGKESSWWRRLKGRAASDRLSRFSFSRKDVLPNSTLVLTMDEVEMIINNHNINILKDRRAINAVFNTLFLLGIVIVDSASELAYFNFDGQSDWQIHSFRSLEKESSSSASDMKSLISLVDKTRR